MTGEVLYRYNADREEAKLVVPQHERAQILQELHDAPDRRALWYRTDV